MRERDRWNAKVFCGGQRGPRQLIRIARFDDVRRESVQQFSPALWAQRQAIAAGARNARTLHFENAVRHFRVAAARHDQTMPHTALLTEMMMFRKEITFHAA